MSIPVISAFLVLSTACALGQTTAVVSQDVAKPAPTPPASQLATTATYSDALGFTYSYPTDWELVDTKPMIPAARLQEKDKATSEPEKKAADCVQIGLLLRHGTPGSVLMSVALPFDCFGATVAATDLPGFGEGVAVGMAREYEMKNPQYGAFKLGTQNLWIERAEGTSKAHPEFHRTVETVCALLKKGAVCWIGMVQDDAAMKIFESGLVTLEGEAPTPLVPADAFSAAKK